VNRLCEIEELKVNTCNIDLKKEVYILAQIHRKFTDDQVKELFTPA